MVDVVTTLRGWSATAASNLPAGGTTIGTGLDDNLRQIQAVVRQYLASTATDMASANLVTLANADGFYIRITGTTTITDFGTESAGIMYLLRFAGALPLTQGSNLILPGGVTITTTAGDMALMVSEGAGNWRCVYYTRSTPQRRIAQIVATQTGLVATGTTVIPADNSVPQNTEGDQYLSRTISPYNAASLLEIDVTVFLSHSAVGTLTAALFQDSTAGALAAGSVAEDASGYMRTINFKYNMTSGSVSTLTFKVRAGSSAAGTTSFNGSLGTQLLDTTMASRITIKEYLP